MKIPTDKKWKWLFAGILFAILWPSASTATKVGLQFAQPLVIAELRFAIAGLILLVISHIFLKNRLPRKEEWKQIAIYGLLNITIYLGCYVVAMQNITAGIGALAVAINPVFISFLSIVFLKHKLTLPVLLSILVCMTGVVCASWPLFSDALVTPWGLVILVFSMLSYSVGAIYFAAKKWNGLSLLTINGWQTLLGGLFLLPVALLFFESDKNHFTTSFWISTSWLAIPVSIVAVLLWLWLLSIHPVRAGLWLFLCPLFGFMIAAWWMHDEINMYTIMGTALVILGLLLSKIKGAKTEITID
jgi:probable blue pigment (indigoidine) exporter